MLPDLAMIVRQATRKGRRRGQEEQSRVLVRERTEQDDACRLEALSPILDVRDARYEAAIVDLDPDHARVRLDAQPPAASAQRITLASVEPFAPR